MLVTTIFSFSHNVFYPIIPLFEPHLKCFLQMLVFWTSKKFCPLVGFNPFPDKAVFKHVCSTILLKTLEKGQIAQNKLFLLFPQCYLPFWRTLHRFHQIYNCRLQTPSVWMHPNLFICERINPLPDDKF